VLVTKHLSDVLSEVDSRPELHIVSRSALATAFHRSGYSFLYTGGVVPDFTINAGFSN